MEVYNSISLYAFPANVPEQLKSYSTHSSGENESSRYFENCDLKIIFIKRRFV
jgi:hypothetical protein